jgi:hypothetical protein
MTLTKNTKITENKNLELRFEAFNLFNHSQFLNPGGDITSSEFGLITAARPGRILQIGARFAF